MAEPGQEVGVRGGLAGSPCARPFGRASRRRADVYMVKSKGCLAGCVLYFFTIFFHERAKILYVNILEGKEFLLHNAISYIGLCQGGKREKNKTKTAARFTMAAKRNSD